MSQSPVFVINPKSHKVNTSGSILAQLAVDYGDIPIVYFDGATPLSEALSPLLREGRDTLYVEGGDGTVLAALSTCFAERFNGLPLPQMAILPGGSTNLAHEVLGLNALDPDSLRHRLGKQTDQSDEATVETHTALLVETSETTTPYVGFLLSTGSLARLMLYTQTNLHGKTRGAVSIARAILQLLIFPNSTRYVDGKPVMRGGEFTELTENHGSVTTEQSFTMFSTFRKLSLGLSPFWARGEAPIGVTSAAWPIHHLRWGIAKAVLTGGGQFLERHGLTSDGCSEMVFRTDGPVILDGEELPMPADQTYKVSVSPSLEFIR